MNDKTKQTVADELRLVAQALHAVTGLSAWSNLCCAADTIDNLRAEKDRLVTCLERANISTEHFEREWYLRGDELDNLRAQLAEAQRDAERWRFFRHASVLPIDDEHPLSAFAERLTQGGVSIDDVDAVIDAARGGSNA